MRSSWVPVSLALILFGCGNALGGLGADVDQACIPDWPVDCAPQDETGGTEAFACPVPPELLEGETVEHSCILAAEDGSCPAADDPCLIDAFEHRFLTSCNDCLRDDIRPLCAADPQDGDSCCYQVGIVQATCG